MGDRPDGSDPLRSLGQRIAAARAARQPERSKAGEEFRAGSLAWRMVTDLVAGVLVGAAMGWGLDALFGTLPILLVTFLLLGFAAGIRVMIRTADEAREKLQGGGGTSPPDRGDRRD